MKTDLKMCIPFHWHDADQFNCKKNTRNIVGSVSSWEERLQDYHTKYYRKYSHVSQTD